MQIKRLYYGLFLVSAAILSCNDKETDSTKTGSQPQGRLDSVIEPTINNPHSSVDKSPLDISYYPADYPELRMNGDDSVKLIARVIYSRPQKKGRSIFGNTSQSLVQFGNPWRLGANEATEIEFFTNVTILKKKFTAGRYTIYCIPYEDKWVIVFNSNLFNWGLHQDITKDIDKIQIPVSATVRPVEYFTMVFNRKETGCELVMSWDNVSASLPISF